MLPTIDSFVTGMLQLPIVLLVAGGQSLSVQAQLEEDEIEISRAEHKCSDGHCQELLTAWHPACNDAYYFVSRLVLSFTVSTQSRYKLGPATCVGFRT